MPVFAVIHRAKTPRLTVGVWSAMPAMVVMLAMAVSATTGRGQESASRRGGGLVPRSSPSASLTREELIRQWDLDGNGTISKPEADVARARMKRQRLEMQFNAGIDPITGLPRSLDEESELLEEGNDEPLYRLPPELPPPPSRSEDRKSSLPGMRPPDIQRPESGFGASSIPRAPGPKTPPAPGNKPAATPNVSGRASWLPPQRLPSAITGGLRAGAPAAAPGYGTGSWAELNANRWRGPSQSLPAGMQGSAEPSASAGGLLPTGRSPGRTGAIIIPNVSGQPRAAAPGGAPQTPRPPTVRPPRITAEEMGGYQP